MAKKKLWLVSCLLLVNLLLGLPAAAAEELAPQPNISRFFYEQMVKDTLAMMKTAYEQKQLRPFMKFVSQDFTGDDFLLYRAVRRDFRFFDDIKLYLYVDSFSIDTKGRAQVAVKYNRNVIANKDSRSHRDSGLTQMTFIIEDGQAKLYDMKFPMIFGLSEGVQITTGIVRTAETGNVIAMDRRGNVSVKSFKDALDIANGTSVRRGMVHLSSSAGSIQSFSLEDNMKVTGASLQGDFGWGPTGPGYIDVQPGTRYIVLPDWSFDSTNEAPDPAMVMYNTGPIGSPAYPGQTLALELSGGGKFAIIEVQSVTGTTDVNGTIRFKYQPSGSRFF